MYYFIVCTYTIEKHSTILVHVRALNAKKTNYDPHVDNYHIVTQGHCFSFSSSSSSCRMPLHAVAAAARRRTPTHTAARRHYCRCRILFLRHSQHTTAVAPESFAARRLRRCSLHVARCILPSLPLPPRRRLLQPFPSLP
jgi:hypothetical protein